MSPAAGIIPDGVIHATISHVNHGLVAERKQPADPRASSKRRSSRLETYLSTLLPEFIQVRSLHVGSHRGKFEHPPPSFEQHPLNFRQRLLNLAGGRLNLSE